MPVARRPRPRPSEIPGAEIYVPEDHSLPVLRAAAQVCRGCPLYKHATQAVFGESPTNAVKHFKYTLRGKRRIHDKLAPRDRGLPAVAKHVVATVHPASVLRAPDDDARHAAREAFFADIALVGELLR